MNVKDYNECVRQYADSMYRYALSITHDTAKAKDAVQNVFAKCWQKKEQIEMTVAKSYLLKSVYRACIDLYRTEDAQQRVREKVIPIDGNKTTYDSTKYELRQLIELALGRLKEEQRSIILLRDYEGYSYKEIGDMLELSEAQVKIKIFRSRKKLQQILVDIGYQPAKVAK